jgi:hypothetical protein
MSALGQKQTLRRVRMMSALAPKAEHPSASTLTTLPAQWHLLKMQRRATWGVPMSDQNGPRGFLQSKAGQIALLDAAIIVLVFFAFTYVR